MKNLLKIPLSHTKKGSKGQFGLGLSIVYKTLSHFNLKMKVENINNGVMFTIEPLL